MKNARIITIKNLCSFLLLALLVSCTNHPSQDLYRLELPEAIEVTPNLVSDDILTQAPVQILVDSAYLVFMKPAMDQTILFINKQTLETYNWGQMGSGPDDFVSPFCIRQDERNWRIWDVNLRKMVEYKLSFNENTPQLLPQKRFNMTSEATHHIWITNLHTMHHGWSIGLVGTGNDGENMFVLLDEEMNVVKTFGTFPVEGLPTGSYMNIYGTFASIGNKLYFASLPTGYIVCYHIGKDGEPKKEWESLFTKPLFSTGGGNWTRDNRDGFFDIKVTNEYLFLAFSGNAIKDGFHLPENLFVLKHDGQWVKNIKLKDVPFGRFAVDGDSIYTWGLEKLHIFNWRELVED